MEQLLCSEMFLFSVCCCACLAEEPRPLTTVNPVKTEVKYDYMMQIKNGVPNNPKAS